MFFELEKIMSASNDVSFYLGRRDSHKITLSNTFPSFNDVTKIYTSIIIKIHLINYIYSVVSRVNTESTFIFTWIAT